MPEPSSHDSLAESKLGIGPLIRRAFGPYEQRLSEKYRRMFVDLDAFIALLQINVRTPSKEWIWECSPAHLFGYLSDRFVTGDRIQYSHEDKLRSLTQDIFGHGTIRAEFRINPWHCNLTLVISPKGSQESKRRSGD